MRFIKRFYLISSNESLASFRVVVFPESLAPPRALNPLLVPLGDIHPKGPWPLVGERASTSFVAWVGRRAPHPKVRLSKGIEFYVYVDIEHLEL